MMPEELCEFITHNPKGTKSPGETIIRSNLDLERFGPKITWLPDNLTVLGSLNLAGCCNLKELPSRLVVCECLCIELTAIKHIPKDLAVRGDIFASDMDLDIPDGFIANRDLYLDGEKTYAQTQVETPLRLPNNLTVYGVLDISHRQIVGPVRELTVMRGIRSTV